MSSPEPSRIEKELSPEVIEKLQAGAFRSLVQHLQERSDEVQNIDLMTLSGFCRNCLAKWMVLEARNIVDHDNSLISNEMVSKLNSIGYDETAEYVYGCDYKTWKSRHMKKSSDEQMALFNESKQLHAKHNKDLLAVRVTAKNEGKETTSTNNQETIYSSSKQIPTASKNNSLLSNVCCEDVENAADNKKMIMNNNACKVQQTASPMSDTIQIPNGMTNVKIGVLTVSDRAFNNQYDTGDLSGPAVIDSIMKCTDKLNGNSNESKLTCNITVKDIIPDDMKQIQDTLIEWTTANTSNDNLNMIFTTGGTGFSKRDVTPEATSQVIDKECSGLMPYILNETSQINNQPLAFLSRGIIGLRNNIIIANLPGNPRGVQEIIPILLPLLIHIG